MMMAEKSNRAGTNDVEQRIIEAAQALFVENGYVETSMSDIAARVGINRPALHYYFRTKDRLFQAAFGIIAQQIFPRLQDSVMASDRPVAERMRNVIDAYYAVFRQRPSLPLFIMREIHRDPDLIVNAIRHSPMNAAMSTLVSTLKEEMAAGKLRTVPLIVLFNTVYGLMAFPFLSRGLVERISESDGMTFDRQLEQWKPYVVEQVVHLLSPKSE